MALVLKDRVKETSVLTGTGAITLAGTTGAYQLFSTIGDGNQTYYAIAGQTTTEWEVGIGTYTLSTNSISRDTILSSSNSNLIVTFSAGTKDVFVTYPSEKGVWLDASDDSNSAATIGTTPVRLGATALTLAGLTSVTVTQDPSVALDLATKQYVDTLVSSGITYHAPVKYEVPDTTGNLTATYNNGTAGVGATLTNAGTQVAFTPDGIVATAGDRVLIYNQTNATQNGVYTVTTVGSGSTNWVLTRAIDADSYGLKDPDALGNGDAFFVTSGNTGAGETYVCTTPGVITFGTTNITFAQISSAQVYTAGTGLTLSPATTFNIANTTVTAAAYGAASKTLTATVNARGQLTALADANIAISMSQVTSGTLGATQGGTGQSSYSIGDILYADTTTSLARLADVATGNALISGGLNAAPAWGKIALASAVSGTLPVANGGTGTTTSTGSGDVVLATSPTLVTPVLGTPASGNLANCTFPTLNQNTTGTAANVTGVVAIANGGTGVTTAQAAIDSLAGATTSGYYLRGNGTNVVMAAIVAGDVPTLNQNTTGTAAGLSATLAIASGGTGATSAAAALTALGAYPATNPNGYTSNTGTVTGVTATSPVASSGGTAPVISMPAATSLVSGYLTNTDWATFNGKGNGTVTGVTGTAPVVSSGGATPAISMAAATALVNGYMTSTYASKLDGIAAGATNVTNTNQLTNGAGFITSAGTSAACSGNAATATTAGNLTGTPSISVASVTTSGTLIRPSPATGYMNGNYTTGESSLTSGCIYTIGGTYVPTTTTLGNMYGVGYGYSTVSGGSTGVGASIWGMYVASGGTTKVFLDSDNGNGFFTGYVKGTNITSGGNVTGSSTSCTGNAATVTTNANLTGDVTSTGNATTLSASGVTAGSYTYSSITVDAKGRLTAASSGASPSAFPSGTAMLFIQTAAPTGWTKSVTHDNKALRIVSGTAGSGGSVAFTTAFASQAVTGSVAATAAATATNQATTAGGSISVTVSAGTLAVGAGTFAVSATTISTAQMPAHTHTVGAGSSFGSGVRGDASGGNSNTTSSTGGGGSHTHGLTGAPTISGSPAVTGQTFTGTSHNHTQDAHSHTNGAFTGTAINLAVAYVDAIIASKD